MDYLISPEGRKMYLKERYHSEMKTGERLDYYPNLQTITSIFPKSGPTFPNGVSVSKLCTSRDLHQSIKGLASQQPASESEHPRTCIRASHRPHLQHFTLTFLASLTLSHPGFWILVITRGGRGVIFRLFMPPCINVDPHLV